MQQNASSWGFSFPRNQDYYPGHQACYLTGLFLSYFQALWTHLPIHLLPSWFSICCTNLCSYYATPFSRFSCSYQIICLSITLRVVFICLFSQPASVSCVTNDWFCLSVCYHLLSFSSRFCSAISNYCWRFKLLCRKSLSSFLIFSLFGLADLYSKILCFKIGNVQLVYGVVFGSSFICKY